MGNRIPHGEAVVDAHPTRKLNDSHHDGYYNVTYLCSKCEKVWTQNELRWDEPQINPQAREQYLAKNSQKAIDTLVSNLSHPRVPQQSLNPFFTPIGKKPKKPRDKEI